MTTTYVSDGDLLTPTNVNSWLNESSGEIFNVKTSAYGAVGDGSTDDIAAINAAITAATSAGGGIVYFPSATYAISATIDVPAKVVLRGAGNSIIKASSAFPTSTPLVELGVSGETFTHGCRLESIQIDCNHVAGSIGVYSTRANERSGLQDVNILRYMAYGVHFSGNNAQNFLIEHCELQASVNAATNATHGIYLENTRSKAALLDISIVPQDPGGGNIQDAGIELEGSHNVSCINIHVEDHRYGVHFNNSFGGVIGYTGNSLVTDGIRIESTDRRVYLFGIQANLGANAINDVGNAVTLTENVVPFYMVSHDNTAFYPRSGGGLVTNGSFTVGSFTNANRGAAGTAGRIIFNTDDGQLNIDDGTNWTLPNGTTT